MQFSEVNSCLSLGCCNEDYSLGDLNIYFSQLWRLGSPVKVPAGLVSGESPLPGVQKAAFLLCLHMVERDHVSVSFYKGSSPAHEGSL